MKTCPAVTLKGRNSEFLLQTSNAPRLHARLQVGAARYKSILSLRGKRVSRLPVFAWNSVLSFTCLAVAQVRKASRAQIFVAAYH
jgi:hypothetical protein